MEMFTLKQKDLAWVVCCRACGHEQALPSSALESDLAEGVAIQCERCPNEEPRFHFAMATATPESESISG